MEYGVSGKKRSYVEKKRRSEKKETQLTRSLSISVSFVLFFLFFFFFSSSSYSSSLPLLPFFILLLPLLTHSITTNTKETDSREREEREKEMPVSFFSSFRLLPFLFLSIDRASSWISLIDTRHSLDIRSWHWWLIALLPFIPCFSFFFFLSLFHSFVVSGSHDCPPHTRREERRGKKQRNLLQSHSHWDQISRKERKGIQPDKSCLSVFGQLLCSCGFSLLLTLPLPVSFIWSEGKSGNCLRQRQGTNTGYR